MAIHPQEAPINIPIPITLSPRKNYGDSLRGGPELIIINHHKPYSNLLMKIKRSTYVHFMVDVKIYGLQMMSSSVLTT
jgi:hypothetical protein